MINNSPQKHSIPLFFEGISKKNLNKLAENLRIEKRQKNSGSSACV